eukprot:245395-Pleurochrysis_carterae.AAC.1
MRWNDYVATRRAAALPVIGSVHLFRVLWRTHTELKEYLAKSHPKCDQCGKWGACEDRVENKTDASAFAERAAIHEAEAAHSEEHTLERHYYDNWWFRGETYQKRVLCVNIDAPTQH